MPRNESVVFCYLSSAQRIQRRRKKTAKHEKVKWRKTAFSRLVSWHSWKWSHQFHITLFIVPMRITVQFVYKSVLEWSNEPRCVCVSVCLTKTRTRIMPKFVCLMPILCGRGLSPVLIENRLNLSDIRRVNELRASVELISIEFIRASLSIKCTDVDFH